jgi:transcriptional regulator with XRE-family HTH domain
MIRPMEPKTVVGNNIRGLRTAKGLTQEGLAQLAGMHPVEIGRAERGVRDLRVSSVAKIGKALDVPASELLRGV